VSKIKSKPAEKAGKEKMKQKPGMLKINCQLTGNQEREKSAMSS